jgi:hypothetical protein
VAANSKLETNKESAWSHLLAHPEQPSIQLESQFQKLLGIKDQSKMVEHLKQFDLSPKKVSDFYNSMAHSKVLQAD